MPALFVVEPQAVFKKKKCVTYQKGVKKERKKERKK
jgi:hypothetical protein